MKQKELKEKYPDKEFGVVNVKRDYRTVGEWDYSRDWEEREVEDIGWEVYLNHSCDEWIIGDLDEAKEFRKNLEEAIDYCQSN